MRPTPPAMLGAKQEATGPENKDRLHAFLSWSIWRLAGKRESSTNTAVWPVFAIRNFEQKETKGTEEFKREKKHGDLDFEQKLAENTKEFKYNLLLMHALPSDQPRLSSFVAFVSFCSRI